MPSRHFTLEEIEAHNRKFPNPALKCGCRVSDAWRCAKDKGLKTLSCHCPCHRYLENTLVKPPASPVVTSEGQKGVPIPKKGAKGRGGPGKRRKEMNQTEREFSRILDGQVDAGEILRWEFESIMFRWGEIDILKYSPDFTVYVDSVKGLKFTQDPKDEHIATNNYVCLRFIEVQGPFKRPGDLRRFKEARNRFTDFIFELWSKTKEHGWKQLY